MCNLLALLVVSVSVALFLIGGVALLLIAQLQHCLVLHGALLLVRGGAPRRPEPSVEQWIL